MVRSLVAVENHKVFGQNLPLVLGDVEHCLPVWREGRKLLSEKIFRKAHKIVPVCGLELNLVKLVNVGRVGGLLYLNVILGGFTQGTTEALAHTLEDFILGFGEVQHAGKLNRKIHRGGSEAEAAHQFKTERGPLQLRTHPHEDAVMFLTFGAEILEDLVNQRAVGPVQNRTAGDGEMPTAPSGFHYTSVSGMDPPLVVHGNAANDGLAAAVVKLVKIPGLKEIGFGMGGDKLVPSGAVGCGDDFHKCLLFLRMVSTARSMR